MDCGCRINHFNGACLMYYIFRHEKLLCKVECFEKASTLAEKMMDKNKIVYTVHDGDGEIIRFDPSEVGTINTYKYKRKGA